MAYRVTYDKHQRHVKITDHEEQLDVQSMIDWLTESDENSIIITSINQTTDSIDDIDDDFGIQVNQYVRIAKQMFRRYTSYSDTYDVKLYGSGFSPEAMDIADHLKIESPEKAVKSALILSSHLVS
jgi:hypothetical protein